MNLRQQIADIAFLTGATFRYGRRYDENINADNGTFPAIVLLEPDQMGFYVDVMTGASYDRYNVFIQFIDKIEMGQQASARDQVVENMRTLAATFIARLNESNEFQAFNAIINGVLMVDTYDANVAGIEINITGLTDTYPRPC